MQVGTPAARAAPLASAHLAWVDLAAARALELPFVTEVVLAELAELLAAPAPDSERRVPYFRQGAEGSRFVLL